MNILFVVGGSYKAFYLNCIKRYKKIDLIVFQDKILYEYDYYDEIVGNKIVSNEMIGLAQKFNCKIVAIINSNLFGTKYKEILYADNEKVAVIDKLEDLNLIIDKKCVTISLKKQIFKECDTIKLVIDNIIHDSVDKKVSKSYLFCNQKEVKLVKNSRIKRKFRKICYFCLRF